MAERLASTPAAWFGQALLYALFALIIGVFSQWPPYRHLEPGQALIKVSFNHQGKPVSACRLATAQELGKLPPNMRAPLVCPRERSPITVEMDLDGAAALRHLAPRHSICACRSRRAPIAWRSASSMTRKVPASTSNARPPSTCGPRRSW